MVRLISGSVLNSHFRLPELSIDLIAGSPNEKFTQPKPSDQSSAARRSDPAALKSVPE
jgi:hypothetical protein